MSVHYNVIIIGLGAHGSSAAYHLSKAGLSVCGIDQFQPPHGHGSSHGQSRIIRQAYFENPFYVPLLKMAYAYWQEIEQVSGKELFLKTGGIMLGAPDAGVVKGAVHSAQLHDIPYEYLHADEIRRRFPAIKVDDDTVGVWEKEGGILYPEACIDAFLSAAQANGVQIHGNEKVMKITLSESIVEVTTSKTSYTADKLVLSVGAWMSRFTGDLHLPLVVKRQALFWFRNANEHMQKQFLPQNLPIFIWEDREGKMFYGFPDLGDGLKIAPHHRGQTIDPDTLTNDVSAAEIDAMAQVAAGHFNMQPVFNYSATCMYTNTPDENFIIDYHPLYKNVCIASPCSGHGFKFASLTGKMLANMVTGQPVSVDMEPFRIARFNSLRQ